MFYILFLQYNIVIINYINFFYKVKILYNTQLLNKIYINFFYKVKILYNTQLLNKFF